jgi:hypothetical protein
MRRIQTKLIIGSSICGEAKRESTDWEGMFAFSFRGSARERPADRAGDHIPNAIHGVSG